MAAELIGAGVDVHEIYRRLYEGIPYGKLELLARGLSNAERYDGGLLTITHLSREDYASTGAEEGYSEGVVDHLRAVEGTVVAGLVRDLPAPPSSAGARSPCARPTTAWTSPRSRGRRAAAVTARRPASRPNSPGRSSSHSSARRSRRSSDQQRPAHRQARRRHLTRRGGEGAPPAGHQAGRPRRDPRSLRHRAAGDPRRPGHPRAALLHGAAQDLRDGRAPGRHLDDRGPRGEITETGRVRPTTRRSPSGRSASARRPTRRSRSAVSACTRRHGAGRRSRRPSAR